MDADYNYTRHIVILHNFLVYFFFCETLILEDYFER